jgi:hypothetical protein
MKNGYRILLIVSISLIAGCITQFIPETDESSDILVVEGLITDQNRTNRIKISKTMPLGNIVSPKPVKGCVVTITDENNRSYNLREYPDGTYSTDSTRFRGHVGGRYTLWINTGGRSYISTTMVMLPVPPVDSLYYERVVITESNEYGNREEGCQIYLDTYDPGKQCLYYRWDFAETWEIKIPYNVKNWRCWINRSSDEIHIKNTSIYDQAKVTKYPILFVTNKTDRLKEKYSILVKQYSLSQDEYNYWEKLQNVYENVGGLYDVTPMAIPSNIHNPYNNNEIVLGYFSVSAIAEKRIFIDEQFAGMPYLYNNCPADTIWGGSYVPIEGLNSYVWVIEDNTYNPGNPYRVITYSKECADCTTRGTSVRPSFWQ